MRPLPAAAAITLASVLAVATPAAAASFTYTVDMPNSGAGSDTIGQIQTLAFGYDDGGDALSASPRLDVSGSLAVNANQGVPTGGWFVLSDGRNAREENGLAILYMDFASGTVVAYEYDGSLGAFGYRTYEQQDRYIATFEDAVSSSVTDGVFSFAIDDLDVSLVQAFSDDEDYTGVSFGERIGIWFHLATFNVLEVGPDGRIVRFSPRADSYYDIVNQMATRDDLAPIPLPAGGVLLLTGLGGLAAARLRRRS